MKEKWYKLDTAAKIFPAISDKDGANYFRICAVLKEKIQVDQLKKAVSIALERFPMYAVKIKEGLFWHYFDHNDGVPLVRKESSNLFDTINTLEHDKFMFCVEYYERRLSLRIFHALSDGTGGLEFFKAIVYYYLRLVGHNITNDGTILTNEYEKLNDESQDSFGYNYDEDKIERIKEDKAYKVKGTPYSDNWTGISHLMMNVENVKEIAKKYNATITEFLGTALLYTMHKKYYDKKKKPITLFVPVNARKIFESKSLRNFVLYIRSKLNMKEKSEYTFNEILNIVKHDFKDELTKEKLTRRLVSQVRIEKNFFIRILPLFIKKIALKLSYKAYGSDLNTISFSNLGVINVPSDFYNYVDQMYFMIGTSTDGPINLSASSYNNLLTLTFVSRIMERTVEKDFIRFLSNEGIKITVQTNDLEVE